MSRTGGEADKFGNRYEDLWTVDAVLDLIDGEYAALTVEAIGDEAAGVEFFRTDHSGTREYHSIKRQQSQGNWTIRGLTPKEPQERSILGDLLKKIHPDARGVFSSGTSATELEDLVERARVSGSFEQFQRRLGGNARLSARFRDRVVPICGDDELAAYDGLQRLCVRTTNEPELMRRVEYRIRKTFSMAGGEPLAPRMVRLLIADLVKDKLGEPRTAESLLADLKEHRILRSRLGGDRTVGDRMQQLNRAYLRDVSALLINGTEIVRQESSSVLRTLVEDRKSVMLEGTAGGGKTGVLAQVVERLEAQGVPCLAVRLDRLTEDDLTAQALGTNRGLPESPTTTLGGFAGDRPSVLCIDQLDALSFVSARQQWAWDTFNALLDEARTYPNMRVLFSCRSFDLEQDARLRALVGNQDEVERIRVGLLDEETVLSAVKSSGVAAPLLSKEQLQVLSTPLHLYLFLEASHYEKTDFTAPGDLFDAFWRRKERAVNGRLGAQLPGWDPAIAALCDVLSERESLVAPEYSLDGHGETLDAMASEAVASIQDGNVRFFHESFFDYAFARTFLRAGKDLVDWLVLGEQPLFRRSQVRQVLAFLRGREGPNSQRYLRTVERLLDDDGVRFHIKRLVLDWLGDLPDPTRDEWLIVEGLERELGDHVWNTVRNSVHWFDVLDDLNRWDSWLNADDAHIDWAVTLLSMPEVLDARSGRVASLIGGYRGGSDKWQDRLWWVARRGNGFASEDMQDLVIGLIEDGTVDDTGPGAATNRDLWQFLSQLTRKAPAFTARVLGAWFDRQIERASELGRDDPFNGEPQLVNHSQISGQAIQECAKQAAHELVRELLPRLVHLEQRVPQRYIGSPSMLGGPDQQIREVLAQAMCDLAEQDPKALDSIVSVATGNETKWTKWMSAAVLRAWSTNPDFYADRAVGFLLEDPDRRLNVGYDFAIGQADILAAVSRTAIAAVSSDCSDASFTELESAIVDFTPDWEWKARRVGRTRLALLRALDQGRITEATRKHMRELERKFPDAQERGAPEPPDEHAFAWVAPPVPREARSLMSNADWLSAMTKYPAAGPTRRDDELVGGSEELARELEEAVRAAPGRFAALVDCMDGSFAPVYFEAILTGLSRVKGSAARPGTLEQVCFVVRRIKELGVGVRGWEIAQAIGALAEEDPPDHVIEMLCRVALEDPSPESDDSSWDPITQAINSGRGAAAVALTRLLFADRGRWGSLKPTVEVLATDPVLAVRSVAVECLTAVLDSDREDALLLFERLVEGADSILGTDHVERFIHYAVFRDYSRVRSILHGMLASSSTPTLEVAARRIVVAALWGDAEEAREDEESVLRAGDDARAAATQVYAANLSDESIGAQCETRLRPMFDDQSEAVRRAAATCWGNLTPDQIASRGALISAFAHSQAFIDSGAGFLLDQLEKAQVPLPMEVCVLAERAVVEYGDKATSVQTAEGGDAYGFSQLLVRLHEETSAPTLRKRILDVIDGMLRAGFLGIDERLRERFER